MRTLLLTTLMIFTFSVSAGLYKWVDDEGNVHYSQKRPLDAQYKKLKAPATAPENSKSLYQQEKTKTTADTTLAAEKEKIKKLKADNCEKAKQSLKAYTVYRRFKGKDGTVRTIDDKERAQQIKNAQKAIKDYC